LEINHSPSLRVRHHCSTRRSCGQDFLSGTVYPSRKLFTPVPRSEGVPPSTQRPDGQDRTLTEERYKYLIIIALRDSMGLSNKPCPFGTYRNPCGTGRTGSSTLQPGLML
jgi:hypothetical protein